MKDTKDTEGELLIPNVSIVAAAYDSDEKIVAMIEVIEAECRAEHYTVETRQGRDRIKSQAYKISRSKTAMDSIGKGLTEEAQKLVKTINSRRSVVTSRFDALRDEIRKPLDDWERIDDLRKDKIKTLIADCFGMRALPADSASLRVIQDETISVELDDRWQEFLEDATKAKDSFLRHLGAKIQDAVRSEEQAAELNRLRQAEAQRQAEAEQQRVRDAEAQAERDRQAKAAAEAQAASDSKIAALQAQLAAMQEQPLPAPVGEPVAAAPAPVQEAPPPVKLSVSVVEPVFTQEQEIAAAVLAVIGECETQEAAAAEIASAICAGEIPYVQAVF